MRKMDERGFTLPELLVVTGVMLGLLVAAMLLLQPASYAERNQDAERRLEMAKIAQALGRYKADHGSLPAGMPTELTLLGSSEDTYNLCAALVPKYLKDIPLDPLQGLRYQGEAVVNPEGATCQDKELQYMSGYAIMRDKQGHITISGLSATGEQLEVTSGQSY